MPHYRRHPLTGEWLISAPERSRRPNAFSTSVVDELCPFCPGNEGMTPPEILRRGGRDSWSCRVFPNKFPAIDSQSHADDGSLTGGAHEVIVESPLHDCSFDQLPPEAVRTGIEIYNERYVELSRDLAHVAIFRNEGPAAGASVPHGHSQIVATPFLPARAAAASAVFDHSARCPVCELVAAPGHVVRESPGFVVVSPAAARMPYEQWILPRQHARDLADLTPALCLELATLLQAAVASLRRVMPVLSFNWSIHNHKQNRAHWHVEIVPRITTLAGYELGFGGAINIIDAAVAADVLWEP